MSVLSGLAGRLPHVAAPVFRTMNLILVAVLAAVVVGGYFALRTTPASSTGAVQTAPVARGVVLSSVSATGTIQPASQVGVDFYASGELTSIDVKVGQEVAEGQVLGKLDSTDATAAVEQAQANLASANANLTETLAGETPQERAQDAVSAQQAAAQVTAANAAVTQANAQLKADETATAQAVKQAGTSTQLTQANTQLRTDRGNESAAVATQKADEAKLVLNGTTYSTAAEAVTAANAELKNAQSKQQADQQTQLALQTKQTVDNQTLATDKSALTDAQNASNASEVTRLTTVVAADQSVVNTDAYNLSVLQQTLQADGTAVSGAQGDVTSMTSLQSAIAADKSSLTNLESKIVSDRNGIATAEAQLSSAVSNAKSAQTATLQKDRQAVQSAKQQVSSASLSVKATAAGNAVKAAPATAGTVAQQRAAVLQASVSLQQAQKSLAELTLRAPEAGKIAAIDGTVGGEVSGGGVSNAASSTSSSSSGSSAGGASTGSSSTTSSSSSSSFVTLIGKQMEVSASFSESDAAKIRVGQPATVTVSALPSEELAAHVVSVGVIGSSSSGVVEYTVVFALDRTNSQLKDGMSANVSDTVDEQDNVLNVPSSAVTGSGASARVTVVKNGVQQTTPVVAGLKGDTTTEIVSGLTAGEQVVTSTGATLFSSSAATGTSTTSTAGAGARRFGGAGGGLGGGLGGGIGAP
ncbi:MAG TPA: biotin/lipoyl-binding protein [Gaiellaceae bacterium]|nr:biotin/lipoyl-binding protein [Gaiellaceae bacterium]